MTVLATRQAFDSIVEQARNLIAAHEARNTGSEALTLNEKQELAVLYIRMDDYSDIRDPST